MKTPFRPGGRPSGGPADEQHLLRALARVERAPDVTGDVMHRLGYRLASARHATRRRRRRVVGRAKTEDAKRRHKRIEIKGE